MMIDDLWLIKLKIDVKSRNPDMLLDEYIKTTKEELLSYTKVFRKGQILCRGRLGYKSYYKDVDGKTYKFKYPYFGKEIKKEVPPGHFLAIFSLICIIINPHLKTVLLFLKGLNKKH